MAWRPLQQHLLFRKHDAMAELDSLTSPSCPRDSRRSLGFPTYCATAFREIDMPDREAPFVPGDRLVT